MTIALSLLGGAGWQFFDANGAPLDGGKLYVYSAGTTTPLTTYTDSTAGPQNTNPIILTNGYVPHEIWLDTATSAKFVLKTSADVEIWTKDNVEGAVGYAAFNAFIASLSGPSGSDTIGFTADSVDAVTRTVQDKLREWVSVLDFGAVGDGVTDDAAAIQNAVDAFPAVYFPYTGAQYYMATAVNVNTANSLLFGPGAVHSAGVQPCFRLYGAQSAVTGLTVSGTGTRASSTADTDGGLIRLLADNCMVKGCIFDAYRYGVEARNCNAPIIVDNLFINGLTTGADDNATAGDAIAYLTDDSTYAYKGLIANNVIKSGFGFGITIFCEDSASPTGTYTTGNATGGIYSTIIADNTVADGHAYGIYLYRRGGSSTLNISQSIVANNNVTGIIGDTDIAGLNYYGAGIYIQGAENTLVDGNTIANCVQQANNDTLTPAGIGVTNVSATTIRNNNVFNSGIIGPPSAGGWGICVKCANVTPANSAAGHGSNPELGNIVIENNYVDGSRLESILVTDTVRTVVRGNTCRDQGAGYDAIKANRSGGGAYATAYTQLQYPEITGNLIYAPKQYGISVITAIGHKVDDNRIYDAVDDGIRLNTCGFGSVCGNQIVNAGTYGIVVLASCDPDQVITGNTFSGCGNAQIYSFKQCLIKDNIHANIAGVAVRLANGASVSTDTWWYATDADTSPDVYYYNQLRLANTGATTVTSFDNVKPGTRFAILFTTGNTTLGFASAGTTLRGNGGVNLTVAANTVLQAFQAGSLTYVQV